MINLLPCLVGTPKLFIPSTAYKHWICILLNICPMKYEEKHPSKVRYLSKIAEMFSSALTAESVQKQKRYQICLVLGIYELGVDKKNVQTPSPQ